MKQKLSQVHLTLTLAQLTAHRLRRRSSTLVLLLLGLVPCAILIFWVISNLGDGRVSLKPYDMFLRVQSHYFLNFYVPLLAIFLGLGAISDEIETRNITFTLVRPLHRASIVVGRLLGHYIVGFGLVSICIIANYAANMFFQIEDFASQLPILLNSVFILCFGLMGYLSVIAVLGTFWRKFAIIAGILWLILDNLFGRTPVDVFKWVSIMYRMSASYWEKHFPFYGFTGTAIESSPAWINAFYCLCLALICIAIMAAKLNLKEIILSEGAN